MHSKFHLLIGLIRKSLGVLRAEDTSSEYRLIQAVWGLSWNRRVYLLHIVG